MTSQDRTVSLLVSAAPPRRMLKPINEEGSSVITSVEGAVNSHSTWLLNTKDMTSPSAANGLGLWISYLSPERNQQLCSADRKLSVLMGDDFSEEEVN